VVGASHLNYDFLVHFGSACFTEDIDLEEATVQYVLPKKSLDRNLLFQNIETLVASFPPEKALIVNKR
jgi:diphthamide biosynthesis enzyme Dph1/Dph2-like protein